MRGLVGLTCLFWLIASSGNFIRTASAWTGVTYTYEAQSDVLAGIPEEADQYSAISIRYILKEHAVDKTKTIFTIHNVRVGKLNDEVPVSYAEDIPFQHAPSPHYEHELSKPFAVYLDEHWQVTRFEAAKDDPIWSVNFKKAIADKFQVDLNKRGVPAVHPGSNYVPRLDPTASIYTVYEDGIGGECETRYSVLSVPSLDHPYQSEDVLNITKVRNFKNCRSRPVFEFDNFEDQGTSTPCEPKSTPTVRKPGAIWRESNSVYESGCHFGFEPDHHPVKSYAIVWYNVSSVSHTPVLEGIWAEGKTTYNLHGKEIMVFSRSNLTLAKTGSLRSPVPTIPSPVRYETLEYQLPEEDYLDSKDSALFAIFGPVHGPELKETIVRFLEELAHDIIPTEPETSQNAASKVIRIVNALNVLKKPELEEVYQIVETEKTQKVPRKKEIMRKLYLDMLSISATDEVALFVHDLIVSKRVSAWEAGELLQGIGKNADEPSDKVIQAYLELLDLPWIQQSRRLYPSAGIAVAKMIQDACVEEDDPQPIQLQRKQQKEQIRHPRDIRKYDASSEEDSQERRPRGPQAQQEDEDECSPQDLQSYIQIIRQKLENAKTFNKMMVLIEVLAHMGTPEVLPHIVPYVTQEAPNAQALDDEDTEFLATTAIYSLHHIVDSYPEEILPIVARIYFDPSEEYEQRIAAFSVLLAADPPLTMLERVATELHYEINNQVASYAHSLLSDLANSTLPSDRKMAQKIQLVLSHAPEPPTGIQYASSATYTFYDDDNNYGLVARNEYVPSNVSLWPRSFYTAVNFIQEPFSDSFLELGANMKGVDELLEKLLEPSGVLSQILSRLGSNVQVRDIPQVLDIIKNRLLFTNQDTDTPRATLFYKLFGRTTYLTLDEQWVVEQIEHIVEFVRQIDLTSGFHGTYVKVWMPASFFRVVPSTVGLPVVVSHRHPVIFTLGVRNLHLATSGQREAPLTSTMALTGQIDYSVHMNSLAVAYFVDPVENKIHGAALEKVFEVATSKEVEVAVNIVKRTWALSVKPKMPQEVFYHNTRPLTFISEASIVRQPKTEWLGSVNEIETIPEPFKFDERKECSLLGLTWRVTGDSENPWADLPTFLSQTAVEDGVVAAYLELFVNPEMVNREMHVYLEPHKKHPTSQLVLTADYDIHLKMGVPTNSREEESQESSDEEEYEKTVSSIYGRSYVVPNAQATIEKLVKKTQATWAPVLGQGHSDPVPATVTHVLDWTLALKGASPKQFALRLLYSHSLDFRSNWFQALGHSSGYEQDRPSHLWGSLLVVYPELSNPFYLQMNTLKSQRAKFEGEIGWGVNSQHQSQIRVKGVMEKSEEQLTTSSGIYESEKDQQSLPWYYKQCQVDRTEGETQSYACQKAIAEDSQLNLIKFHIIAPNLPPAWKNVTHRFDQMLKYMWYPNMEINPLVSNPEDRVTVTLQYSQQVPDIPLIELEIEKPTETVVFSKLYWPYYQPPSTLHFYENVFLDQFFDDDYYPQCNLQENFVSLFDNVTVELPDNKCQYLLSHDASPDKAFTILASQVEPEAKTKALSMVLADHTVKVLPPQGEVFPVVIDGKEHHVVPSKPVVLDFDKDSELRVFVRQTSGSSETPIIRIHAVDDAIHVIYDGKNAIIRMPRSFQGDHVGLCGDFNDEQFQEFVGPNSCVWVEEEDFVNSFAVPGQSCPKPPKPDGPAFCPPGVVRPVNEEHKQPSRHYDNSVEDEVTSREHRHHKKQDRRRPSSNEDDISAPFPEKKHRSHPRSEESEEDDKPSGPAHCVKQYTHTFEDEEGKTCFSTQPSYKCHSDCRPMQPQPRKLPFHCLSPSKHEKILKDQARHGVLPQIQNKHAEKFRYINIPEQCV